MVTFVRAAITTTRLGTPNTVVHTKLPADHTGVAFAAALRDERHNAFIFGFGQVDMFPDTVFNVVWVTRLDTPLKFVLRFASRPFSSARICLITVALVHELMSAAAAFAPLITRS